jgi:3-deoxy-manno-octulosonate cytidylyltransferase (CMP-KDO synthetase)
MLRVPHAQVVVVTDDERIAGVVEEVGARAFVSFRPAASGSDRIRNFLNEMGDLWPALLVNVQGDEPLLEPEAVGALVELLARDESIRVATLLRGAPAVEEAGNPDVVKAALLPDGRIEDFARLPLEDLDPVDSEEDLACARRRRWLVHVGVYAFRSEAFRAFTDLPPSQRETKEGLEQLRMIENGIPIHGLVYPSRSIAVDTAADVERVREILRTATWATADRGEGAGFP